MLAFAAAVQIGKPLQFATIEPAAGIALWVAGAVAGYWLGSLPLPRWSSWLAAALWLASLAAFVVAAGTHDIECSSDPQTRTNAMKAWIAIPALSIALGCPAFFGRNLSTRHIIAVPVGFGFAALGLTLALGVAFAWVTRPCLGVVY